MKLKDITDPEIIEYIKGIEMRLSISIRELELDVPFGFIKNPLLINALKYGKLEIAEKLLSLGANPAVNTGKYSALWGLIAFSKGNESEMHALAKRLYQAGSRFTANESEIIAELDNKKFPVFLPYIDLENAVDMFWYISSKDSSIKKKFVDGLGMELLKKIHKEGKFNEFTAMLNKRSVGKPLVGMASLFLQAADSQNNKTLVSAIVNHAREELISMLNWEDGDIVYNILKKNEKQNIKINVNEKLNVGNFPRLPLEVALNSKNKIAIQRLVGLGADLKLLKDVRLYTNATMSRMNRNDVGWVNACGNIALTKQNLETLLEGNFDNLSKQEVTPLGAAVCGQQFENVVHLTQGNIQVPDILGLNAGMWAIHFFGETSYFEEVNTFCLKSLKKLRSLGFDLNAHDVYGNTLATLVVQRNLKNPLANAFDALIELGVDFNNPNKNGETPLIIAIKNNDLEMVKKLLLKTNILQENPSGRLALEIAINGKNQSIIDLVREHTIFSASLEIDSLLKMNKIDEARMLALKVLSLFAGSKKEELAQHWGSQKASDLVDEVLAELSLKQQKEFAEYLDLLNKKLHTGLIFVLNDENDLVYRLVENEHKSAHFEQYLKEKNNAVYEAFKEAKIVITISQYIKLYNANDQVGAEAIFRRGNFNFVEVVRSILIFCVMPVPILEVISKTQFGNDWGEKLYKYIRDNPKFVEAVTQKLKNQDSFTITLIYEAVSAGDLALLKKFIGGKKLLNQPFDRCPLDKALEMNRNDILEYLLSEGADPVFGCNFNRSKTLLELAKNEEQRIIIERFIKDKKEMGKPMPTSTPSSPKALEKIERFIKDKKEMGKPMPTSTPSSPKALEKKADLSFESVEMIAKRIGHNLGIKKITVRIEDLDREIDLEGALGEEGFDWVTSSLELHLNKESSNEDLRVVTESYQATRDILSGKKDRGSLFKRYQDKKPVVVAAEFHEHGFAITLQDGFLSVTNRGVGGDQKYGTKIYKIKPGVDIEQFIKKVMIRTHTAAKYDFCTSSQTVKFFDSLLEEAVDLNAPFDKIDQKGQKRGHCAVSNRKSAMQGMQYIRLLLASQERGENIEEKKNDFRKESKKFYKHHSNFRREAEIDAVFKDIESMEKKNINSDFYYSVLTAFIQEHNDFNKKNGLEGQRICRIWDKLPENYQKRILHEIPAFQSLRQQFLKAQKAKLAQARSEALAKSEALSLGRATQRQMRDNLQRTQQELTLPKKTEISEMASRTHLESSRNTTINSPQKQFVQSNAPKQRRLKQEDKTTLEHLANQNFILFERGIKSKQLSSENPPQKKEEEISLENMMRDNINFFVPGFKYKQFSKTVVREETKPNKPTKQ